MMPDMKDVLEGLMSEPRFISKVKHSVKEFETNTRILNKGESHPYFYLIMKGHVRILIPCITEEIPVNPGIAELHTGDFFGEFALFEDLTASADVVTTSNTKLMEIEISSFRKYLEENKDVAYIVLNIIITSLIKRILHGNKATIRLLHWGLKAHDISEYLK